MNGFDEIEAMLEFQGLAQSKAQGPARSIQEELDDMERERARGLRALARERLERPERFEREIEAMRSAAKVLPLQGLGGAPLLGCVGPSLSREVWSSWDFMELFAAIDPRAADAQRRWPNEGGASDAMSWLLRWRHEPAALAFGLGAMASLRADAGSSWLAIDSHGNLLGLLKSVGDQDARGMWSETALRQAGKALGALCLGARRAMRIQTPIECEPLRALAKEGAALREARALDQATAKARPKGPRGL